MPGKESPSSEGVCTTDILGTIIEQIEGHPDAFNVELARKTIEIIRQLRELHEKQRVIMEELEYTLLTRSTFQQHCKYYDPKKPLQFKVHWAAHNARCNNGLFIMFQEGGHEVAFDVFYRTVPGGGDLLDIWGNPALDEVLTHRFLVRYQHVSEDQLAQARKARYAREEDARQRGMRATKRTGIVVTKRS